ncbi:DUF2442 domain-containing protein (plasmid) [Deinococcus taeanensis]|uniref:DUF2442 domain-containing protein n=1 Tax=Deinococcus taeanensis TaxID=2737050 RepID=UPI001CDBDA1B|nr:DUF2442 domain-containing protein [Deinococcus taeanensis]UBV45558.1 DUF2442 domain-containing protein [Deinococcus taeanensis]
MGPADLRITDVWAEGDHHTWVTLNDGQTRLLNLEPLCTLRTHHSLRWPQIARQPVPSPDGQHVLWPSGAALDLASIRAAPHGALPVGLDALLPQAQRYRPMLPYLKGLEPAPHAYLDVRPLDRLLPLLGLRQSEWRSIAERYQPVPAELVHARLSDLALILTSLVPAALLPSLIRQPWNHALQRCPHQPHVHTAAGCIRFGRLDLIETPLLMLLRAPAEAPQSGCVVHLRCETVQRPSASDECEGRGGSEQRGW